MDIKLEKAQKLLEWTKNKLWLDANAHNSGKRYIKRGQVYNCDLGIGIGSEMQKNRPCVIVQNNIGNANSGNTIIVPITHNKQKLPIMIPIDIYKSGTEVILDGQVNVSELRCVSKARLGDLIVTLNNQDMEKIDEGIAKSLDIIKYYAKLDKKYMKMSNYLEKVKQERNEEQDYIKHLLSVIGVTNKNELEHKLLEMKNTLDK